MLIGTNNFVYECSAEVTVMGIIRAVEEILVQKPASTVVINQILPRSKPYNMDGYVYVLPEDAEYQPILQYYVDTVNRELQAYAEARDGVIFFSTDVFWIDPAAEGTSKQIDISIMPDALHPYATGYDLWAQEIVSTLDGIVG